MLQASLNYLWSTQDMLGQGATGAVYKARNKKNGEFYAVKTSNEAGGYRRTMSVQMREFEVLSRLNHKNIVKILAIEEEVSMHSPVIVMELCTGGSLYTILDDPENAFGLEEEEFFCVLYNVANGLKYLRDQEIVHRDIKPGNIMRYIEDDGTSLYKLIDFGAARKLPEEEQFMSLYGTEEYLYPDMYEKAVLHRPTDKQFGACVDLWSLGVTLYHVATGRLPFKPYGGRKNREMMYRITTEKASGVISGMQHKMDGEVIWSQHLPTHCRLSVGARQAVTPMLAGLMENDNSIMWSFDRFFTEVNRISNKVCVHVMSLYTGKKINVYVDKHQSLAKLQELITEQMDIHPSRQHLMFENSCISQVVTSMQEISSYPPTSLDNLIYVYPMGELADYVSDIHRPELPPFHSFGSSPAPDSDPYLAKVNMGIAYLIKHNMEDMNHMEKSLTTGTWQYELLLHKDLDHVRYYVGQFEDLCRESECRISYFLETHQVHQQLLQIAINTSSSPTCNEARLLLDDLSDLVDQSKAMLCQIKPTCEAMGTQSENIIGLCDRLKAAGNPQPNYEQSVGERCTARVKEIIRTNRKLMDNIRHMSMKRMSYSDDQVYKFDRSKFYRSCGKCLVQFEDTYRHLKADFSRFQDWFKMVAQIRLSLHKLEKTVATLVEKQGTMSEMLDELSANYANKLKEAVQCLQGGDMTGATTTTTATTTATATKTTAAAVHTGTTDRKRTGSEKSDASSIAALPDRTYRRELMKQLRNGVVNLRQETDAVKSAIEDGSDLIKQLESISFPSTDMRSTSDNSLTPST